MHDPTQGGATQAKRAAAKEALGRLQRRQGPNELRLLLLALMMSTDNPRERKLWVQQAQGLHQAQGILDDLALLTPQARVPEFERVVGVLQSWPTEQRREVVVLARDLLRADGVVTPRERLWWLVLRHRLASGPNRPSFMRPVTGQGQALIALNKVQRHHVAAVTAYLARFIPEDEPAAGQPGRSGQGWYGGVLARCLSSDDVPPPLQPPDADQLMTSLAAVQELSWMVRPLLLKAWVEEAFNHSPKGVLNHATADALRLVAGLVDSPLPAMLAAHYTD